MTEPAIQT